MASDRFPGKLKLVTRKEQFAGEINFCGRQAHTIDATPERSATRRSATAEASVTTRIRQRLQDISATQQETTDTSAPLPVQPLQPALFNTPVPRVSTPKPSYRQRATQDERPAKPQLSLF
jgi:hypothetical protein